MNPYEGIDLSIRIPESAEIIEGEEAKKYAAKKDNRNLTTRMVALDILEKIPASYMSKNILEVCCGTGDLTQELYRLTSNSKITGTDGSETFINEARRRYPDRDFKVMNVHSLVEERYDVVICKDAFHHFNNPKQGLRDLLKYVSYGGYVYIFDLNRQADMHEVRRREEAIVDPHSKKRFLRSLNASLTAPEFSEIATAHGIIHQLESATIYYPFSFSNEIIEKSRDLIEKDTSKEHELKTLFAVYVLKEKK